MSIADEVLAIVADVAESDDVLSNPDVRLYDEHLMDSLRTVELIVKIGAVFGMEISPADVERARWATPALIAEDVTRRLADQR